MHSSFAANCTRLPYWWDGPWIQPRSILYAFMLLEAAQMLEPLAVYLSRQI